MFLLRHFTRKWYTAQRRRHRSRSSEISSQSRSDYRRGTLSFPHPLASGGLHQAGKFVAVETNGTHPLPDNVDWVTLSPKDHFESNATPVLTRCNELKVVCDGTPPPTYPDIEADHHFVQPCDVGDAQENQRIMAATVAFCLEHPTWRLSLQTHKIAGIQ